MASDDVFSRRSQMKRSQSAVTRSSVAYKQWFFLHIIPLIGRAAIQTGM